MEENPEPYQNYSGVTIQRRRNKKKKRKNLVIQSKQLDENSDTTGRDLKEDEEEYNSSDETTEPRSAEVYSSTVYLDGMLKAPPTISVTPDEDPETKDKLEYQGNVGQPLEIVYNTKALSKFATTYELENFKKNALIIFNQENIDGYKPRLGTEKDVESLKSSFAKFNFEVVEHKDLTKDEVLKELRVLVTEDFTEYGCVAVAVLTHGTGNGLLRAKDQLYSEIEIINHFKVHDKPTLVTKPKILIIQACRGTKSMQAVPVFQMAKIRKDHDQEVEPYTLPVEADMLILHSSYIGNSSHRDEQSGSWFVQSLCSKIDQLAETTDLVAIITEVQREVAIDKLHEEYNRKTYEMDINKQMPVVTSTFIRKFYFKKYGDVSTASDSAPKESKQTLSSHEVLDAATPKTPMMMQYWPCTCFLNHFVYIRNCLRYYIEENSDDDIARNYLMLADTFVDVTEFNTAKEKISKMMSDHLFNRAKHHEYYKYLYFYKHPSCTNT